MPRVLPPLITMFLLLGTLGCVAKDTAKVPDPKPIALIFGASNAGMGQPRPYAFTNAAELEKEFPKHTDRFDRAVDWKNEDLILVRWGSSGPPFGKLTYKTDKTTITFAVEEPQAAIRGQAYKLSADWFTVAKGTEVQMSMTTGGLR